MSRFLKSAALLACVFVLINCGSSNKTAPGTGNGDVELNLPCSGPSYQTDLENVRATMYALSSDMATAKIKALALARAELATSISALVKRTNDNYTSSYQAGEQEEARSKMNDLSQTVVKQDIGNSRIICEKMMKTPENQYRCYVTVETSAKTIATSMKDKIMQDERLRTDFEYEKYKKTFDAEMQKLDK